MDVRGILSALQKQSSVATQSTRDQLGPYMRYFTALDPLLHVYQVYPLQTRCPLNRATDEVVVVTSPIGQVRLGGLMGGRRYVFKLSLE